MKLHYYISNMLDQFSNIYPFLDQGQYVTSTTELLKVMSPISRKNRGNDDPMIDLTQLSLKEELLKQNLPENLIGTIHKLHIQQKTIIRIG